MKPISKTKNEPSLKKMMLIPLALVSVCIAILYFILRNEMLEGRMLVYATVHLGIGEPILCWLISWFVVFGVCVMWIKRERLISVLMALAGMSTIYLAAHSLATHIVIQLLTPS